MRARHLLQLAPLALALAVVGGGCDQSQQCLTNQQFFDQQVWGKVLQPKCLKCHGPEGVAAEKNAALLLLPPAYPAFLDSNYATLVDMTKNQYEGKSKLLIKPLGELDHGGGRILQQGDAEFSILKEWVDRQAAPVTCGDKPASVPQAGAARLELLSDKATLRKAALALVGRLPSDGELALVASKGADGLAPALDVMMKDPAFLERVKEIYNDIFLTNRYASGNALDLLAREDWPQKAWWNPGGVNDDKLTEEQRRQRFLSHVGVASEPLELVAWVVGQDKPFSEILTADYTLVNAWSARVYGLDPAQLGFGPMPGDYDFRPAKTSITRDGMMLPTPHAGVLTQTVYLRRFPTTDTNRNRHRARMTLKNFLATDILRVAERPIDPSAATGFMNPTKDNTYCNVCHKVLDPIAGAYQKWGEDARFRPDAKWPPEMPLPGFARKELVNQGDYPAALQWLARRVTEDPRFAASAIHTAWRGLTGREPLTYPAENAPDFAARLDAWRAQEDEFSTIATAFRAGGMSFKSVVKSLVLSPRFRAVNAALESADDAVTFEGFGSGRYLTPELLARKIKATLGLKWSRYDRNDWLLTDYLLLYGGIDSNAVTERLTTPNGIMANVAMRMANEMACGVTAWEFTRPPAERNLLRSVEPSHRPEDDNGYPVPRAIAVVKEQVRQLHERLLGEELSVDDPEIERTYQLFLKTFRELQASGVVDMPWDCRGRWDRVTGKDLPAKQIIDRDNYFTIRSWQAVVTYLLLDYKFLTE